MRRNGIVCDHALLRYGCGELLGDARLDRAALLLHLGIEPLRVVGNAAPAGGGRLRVVNDLAGAVVSLPCRGTQPCCEGRPFADLYAAACVVEVRHGDGVDRHIRRLRILVGAAEIAEADAFARVQIIFPPLCIVSDAGICFFFAVNAEGDTTAENIRFDPAGFPFHPRRGTILFCAEVTGIVGKHTEKRFQRCIVRRIGIIRGIVMIVAIDHSAEGEALGKDILHVADIQACAAAVVEHSVVEHRLQRGTVVFIVKQRIGCGRTNWIGGRVAAAIALHRRDPLLENCPSGYLQVMSHAAWYAVHIECVDKLCETIFGGIFLPRIALGERQSDIDVERRL